MHHATPTRTRAHSRAISARHVLVLFLCYCLVLQPNAAFASPVGLNHPSPNAANNAGVLNNSPNGAWTILDPVFSFFEGSEAVPAPVVVPVDAAVSRKVPTLSNGRVEGNLRVYTGQDFSFEGGFVVTNETYVVGTPNVTIATNATFTAGTIDESGSPNPVGYIVAINGTSRLLGKIHRRSDPLAFPADIPASVPQPTGTRIVNINTSADLASIGDWTTLKELHVNKSGETITVPSGNYGSFSVTGNSRLNFTGGVYNFKDGFAFASNASIKVTGVTTINVGTSATISNTGVLIGENTLPGDIKINVLGPTLSISGNATVKALVRVPNGTATVTGASQVRGQVIADKLEIINNGNVIGDTSSNAPGDTTPPTVTINSPSNNETINSPSVTVTVTASDPGVGASGVASVMVNNVAATYNPSSATWSVNVALNYGQNPITVVATDGAGNSSAAQQIIVTRPQDTTPPTVAITSPLDGSSTDQSSITVSGTVSDPGAYATGVAQVTVNGSPATLNLQDGTWTITNVSISSPSTEISAIATDNAGNASQPAKITVNRQNPQGTPDTTPPTVTITSPLANSTTYDATVNLAGTAQDNGLNATGVQSVTVNGTPASFDPVTHQWAVTNFPLAFGPNPIVVTAIDKASPANQAQVTVTITRLHLEPPRLTITNPLNAAVVSSSSITIAGTVFSDLTDNLSVTVKGTSTPIINGQFARTVQLSEGSNSIEVVATDGQNQHTQSSITVIRDVTAPAISFVNAPISVQPGGTYQVLVTATDNVGIADVELRLNGERMQTLTTAPFQFTLSVQTMFAPGITLVLSAVARDVANTTSVATMQIQTAGPGGISGYVFDDTTGYVMKDVSALLNGSSPVTTDELGVYSFVSTTPAGVVRLSKDGYTPVERLYKVAIGEGTALFDARLTPLDSQTNSIGASGGTINGDSGRVQVNFVAGALSQQTDLRVTSVSPQGLANLLPYGWSPVPGAIIDVRTAAGSVLQSPAHLTISQVSGLASTTPLTLARYDEPTHSWMVVGVGLQASAGGALSVDLQGLGQYAFLVADTGATAPPTAVVGQPLPSSSAADSAALDSAQATAESSPRTAAFSAIAKSSISFFATAPSQLPSGVSIEASFGETYNLLGGKDPLLVDRPAQDFVLYAYPGGEQPNRLGAIFIAKPTRTNFSITELFNANVHVEIRSGRQNKLGALIDNRGGSLRAGDGSQLLIPADAVSSSQSAFFDNVSLQSTGVSLPAGYEVLAAFDVDLGSANLNSAATISVPGLTGDLSRVVVGQLITVGGQRSPKVVARAIVDTDGKLSSTTAAPAGVTLRGIRSTGRYVFIRVPSAFGYIKGTITDAATSAPQSMVRVSTNQTPFVDVTASDGQYVLVGTAGATPTGLNQIGAAALSTDATGTATAELDAQDAVATTNIALSAVALQVESITPASGAQNMIATTPVTVTFNKPVAAQTLTGSSFSLSTNAGNPVLGNITVLAGSRVVVFTPAATLAASTTYKVSLTTGVRDIYGHALGAAFNSTFTTAATVVINNRLKPEQITIGYPDATGTSTISVPSGSVPNGSNILVINTTSGSTLSTTAGTGALTLQMQARVGDEISLTITQPDGTQYSVTQAAYRRADGVVSVGSNGGALTSDDGQVLLSIPSGAISGQAELKLSTRAESDINIPRTGEMDPTEVPFGAGVRITATGNFTNNQELHLEVAAPPTATEGQRVAWMKPAKITEGSVQRDVWEVVTSGKVEGGKFKTMSPPFVGVTIASNVSFYDVYVFVPRRFRAVTGIVTEQVYNAAPKPLENVTCVISGNGSSIIAKTAANGRFGLFDTTVSTADVVQVEATDTLGRKQTVGATPYLSIDPLTSPGLNGLASMFAAIQFPSSSGLPETLPALLRVEGRMLDLEDGQLDTLKAAGRVLIGAHLEIKTTATPNVAQITGQLLQGGTVVKQLVWTNSTSEPGAYLTDFRAESEGSYSVAVTTFTQANVQTTKATATFSFVALRDPNTRPSLEGPPKVLSTIPADKAQQVNVGNRIHLEFSEPVKNLVAGQTIYLTKVETGEKIGGELSSGGVPISANQPNISSVDLAPAQTLEADKEYAIEVSTAVTDSDNHALDQEFTSTDDNSPQPFRSTFRTFRSLVLTQNPEITESYRIAAAGELAITMTPGSASIMHVWDISTPETPKFITNQFVPTYAIAFDLFQAEHDEDAIKVEVRNRIYRTIAAVVSFTPQNPEIPINLTFYSLDIPEQPSLLGVVSLNIPKSLPAIATYVKIHGTRAYIGSSGRGCVAVVDLQEAARQLATDDPDRQSNPFFRAYIPNGGYDQDSKKQAATYGHSDQEAAPVSSLSVIDQDVPAPSGGGALRSPVAYVTSNKPQLFSFDFHASKDTQVTFTDGDGNGFDDRVLASPNLDPVGFALDVRAIANVNFHGQDIDLAVLLGADRLWIFNVKNPRAPEQYTSFSFSQLGLDNSLARRMEVDGTTAYVMFPDKVAVIDFSDPNRPYVSSTITDIGTDLRWIDVVDGFVFTLDNTGALPKTNLRVSIGGAAALVYVHGRNRDPLDVCANPVLISRTDNRMLQDAETIYTVYGHDAPQSAKVIIRKETVVGSQTNVETVATLTPEPDPTSTANVVRGRARWPSGPTIDRTALYTSELILDEGQPTEFRSRKVEIPFSNLIDQFAPQWGIPNDGIGKGYLPYLLGGNAAMSLLLIGAAGNAHSVTLQDGQIRAYGFQNEPILRRPENAPEIPAGRYTFRLTAVSQEVPGLTDQVEGIAVIGEVKQEVRQPGSIVVNGVELESGNLVLSHTDLAEMKNRGLSLSFTRFYNSIGSSSFNPFGYGWHHNYQVLLTHIPTNTENLDPAHPVGYYQVIGGEGSGQTFDERGLGAIGVEATADAPFQGKLRRNGDGTFDYFTRARVKYHFERSIEAGSASIFNLGYMGNLAYIEEPNGNRLTLSYDGLGRLFAVQDSSGRKLEFTYEQALTPFVGVIDSGTVSGQGVNCTSRRFLKSLRQRFLQADVGKAWRIIKVKAPGGLTLDYDYDGEGNLQKVIRSGADQISQGTPDSIWQYAYNPNTGGDADPNLTHLLKSVRPPNQQDRPTTYTYDLAKPGRPVKTVAMPESVTNSFDYVFDVARITSATITDGRGNPTSYQFAKDADGNRTVTVQAPRGAQTIVSFDNRGHVKSTTDPEGMVTTYRYDNGNPVETVVSGNGQTIRTSATYDPTFNKLTSFTDGNQQTTGYSLDNRGNVTQIQLPTGRTVTLDYLGNGDLSQVTDQYGFKTIFENFDSFGNPRTVRRQTTSNTFVISHQNFDTRSRLLSSDGDLEPSVANVYDGLDHIVQQIVTDPSGFRASSTATVTYLPEGQIKTLNKTGGVQQISVINEYDGLNRLVTSTQTPSGAVTLERRFQYDRNSNLEQETDRRGVKRIRTFDALNFITSETLSGPYGASLTTMTATEVDKVGNPKQVRDLYGQTVSFDYDGLHRLSVKHLPLGFTEEFSYDGNNNIILSKDRNGRETKFKYDAANRRTELRDPAGRVTTWSFDDSTRSVTMQQTPQGLTEVIRQDGLGRELRREIRFGSTTYPTVTVYDGRKMTVTDPRGTVSVRDLSAFNELGRLTVNDADPAYSISMRYGALGGMTSSKDALNRETTYTVDGLGRTTLISLPSNVTEQFAYDGEGLVVSHTDRRGFVSTMTYDNLQRALTTKVQDGPQTINVSTTQYDDANNSQTDIDANGNPTVSAFDGLHRVSTLTNADNKPRQFFYDGMNLRREGDFLGRFTEYEYDAVDRISLVKDRKGQVTNILTNDSNGYTRTITDRRGNVRVEVSDPLGRLTSVTLGGEPLVSYEYDGANNRTLSKDGLTNPTTYAYDKLNRVTTINRANLQTETFTYDAVGNVQSHNDGHGPSVLMEYDELNHLKKRTDGENNVTLFVYDGEGLLSERTDPKGTAYRTRYQYNALRSLKSVIDANNKPWSFVYDDEQNLKSVTDARNKTVQYDYDVLNRLQRVTQPLDLITTYGYDANSNRNSITDPKNQITSIAFDELDRPTNITYSNTSGSRPLGFNFGRDPEGNLTSVVEQLTPTTNRNYARSYDSRNRVTSTTDPSNRTVRFFYDAADNLKQIKDADQKDTNYSYDALNRLQNVAMNGGATADYTWFADGLLQKVEYGSGLKREYSYDNADRLTAVTNTVGTDSGGQTQQFAYGYDRNSNRITETRKQNGQTIRSIAYDYDLLDRLTTASYNAPGQRPANPPAGQSVNYTEALRSTGFGYDEVGNRTSANSQDHTTTITLTTDNNGVTTESRQTADGPLQAQSAQFDEINRLVSLTTASDPTGAVTYSYDRNGNLTSTTKNSQELTRYEYDCRDQLRRVLSGNQEIASYDYDFERHRLSKSVGGSDLKYVYAGDQVINEYDESNLLKNRYDLGAGEVARAELGNGEGSRHFFSDALGSITALSQKTTTTTSNLTATYEYDAWGQYFASAGSSFNAIGFTGQRFDGESGLMPLGNGERYYSPAVGSFIQQDSFTGLSMMAQSMNRYSYVHNNPTRFTDPTGHIVGIDDVLYVALIGFLVGTLYGVARQQAEISDGTRKQIDFSLTEAMVYQGLPGAVLAPVLAVYAPVGIGVGIGLSLYGIAEGAENISEGHTYTGAVDIGFGVVGVFFGARSLRAGRPGVTEVTPTESAALVKPTRAGQMELPFEPRANVGPRQPELPFGESVRGQSRAVAEPVAPDYTRQMRLPFDGPEPKQLALSFRGKPNPIGEKGPFYVNQTGQVTTGRGITRLGRPGFLEFEGLEVRAARDLSHLSESTLRAMSELGFAAKDPVSGDPLVLHHLNQQPAGPLVEIPASKHSVWNTRQHPLGNTKGSGLTPEQRAVFNPWRNEYWKARAIEELKLRGLL
ncbi:MAG TPA: Ig-like domain-containing protein [Pyrinomonadaceae bacterium]|nr:Ig-like domain-containing protein [Pyrinomonadaceae bacterium]